MWPTEERACEDTGAVEETHLGPAPAQQGAACPDSEPLAPCIVFQAPDSTTSLSHPELLCFVPLETVPTLPALSPRKLKSRGSRPPTSRASVSGGTPVS